MESSPVHNTPPVEEDEWDTEGFVIPSLGIENPNQDKSGLPEVKDVKLSPPQDKLEKIYLGPHGGKPQPKQQSNSSSRKHQFKQKLKEADKRTSGTTRENRVDTLRELVGSSGKSNLNMAKDSPRDWLDPHCDESQFERRHPH